MKDLPEVYNEEQTSDHTDHTNKAFLWCEF